MSRRSRFFILLFWVGVSVIAACAFGLSNASTSRASVSDAGWRWYWRQPPYQPVLGGLYLLPDANVVAVDLTNSANVFLANVNAGLFPGQYLYPDGVYKSNDHGKSWQFMGKVDDYPEDSPEAPTVLVTHPLTPATLYLGYERTYWRAGIYRSADSGATWSSVLPYVGVNAIAFAPSNPEIMYAATYSSAAPPSTPGGIYGSTDGGQTWSLISTQWLDDIQVHPTIPTVLYGVSWNTTYRSDDGGMTWTQLSNIEGQGDKHLLLDTTNPNRLYVYGRDYGNMHRSEDGGLIWTRLTDSLPPNPINGTTRTINYAQLDPVDSNTIWMSEKYVGIWVSHDRGDTWDFASQGIYSFGGNAGPQCYSISLSPDGYHAAICNDYVYVLEPDHGTATPIPTQTPVPTSTPTPFPVRVVLPFVIHDSQP